MTKEELAHAYVSLLTKTAISTSFEQHGELSRTFPIIHAVTSLSGFTRKPPHRSVRSAASGSKRSRRAYIQPCESTKPIFTPVPLSCACDLHFPPSQVWTVPANCICMQGTLAGSTLLEMSGHHKGRKNRVSNTQPTRIHNSRVPSPELCHSVPLTQL
jgi:hypothetical protein